MSKSVIPPAYIDPPNPALPKVEFDIDLSTTALVITDPQIDFLSRKKSWLGGVWRKYHRAHS